MFLCRFISFNFKVRIYHRLHKVRVHSCLIYTALDTREYLNEIKSYFSLHVLITKKKKRVKFIKVHQEEQLQFKHNNKNKRT